MLLRPSLAVVIPKLPQDLALLPPVHVLPAEDVFTFVSASFAAQEAGYPPYVARDGSRCRATSTVGAATVKPSPGYDIVPGNPGTSSPDGVAIVAERGLLVCPHSPCECFPECADQRKPGAMLCHQPPLGRGNHAKHL